MARQNGKYYNPFYRSVDDDVKNELNTRASFGTRPDLTRAP